MNDEMLLTPIIMSNSTLHYIQKRFLIVFEITNLPIQSFQLLMHPSLHSSPQSILLPTLR